MYEHSVGALIQLGLATFHKLNAKILWCPSEMLDKVVDGQGLERQKSASSQSLEAGAGGAGGDWRDRLRAVDLQNQRESIAWQENSATNELEVELFM